MSSPFEWSSMGAVSAFFADGAWVPLAGVWLCQRTGSSVHAAARTPALPPAAYCIPPPRAAHTRSAHAPNRQAPMVPVPVLSRRPVPVMVTFCLPHHLGAQRAKPGRGSARSTAHTSNTQCCCTCALCTITAGGWETEVGRSGPCVVAYRPGTRLEGARPLATPESAGVALQLQVLVGLLWTGCLCTPLSGSAMRTAAACKHDHLRCRIVTRSGSLMELQASLARRATTCYTYIMLAPTLLGHHQRHRKEQLVILRCSVLILIRISVVQTHAHGLVAAQATVRGGGTQHEWGVGWL